MFIQFAACCVFAQQAPLWTSKVPTPGNSTYIYVCEKGVSTSQLDAYNTAIAKVLQTAAGRIHVSFDSKKVAEALRDGEAVEVISAQYNIPINKVCEHTDTLRGGSYRVYVLCQVAIAGNIQPHFEYFDGCKDLGGDEQLGISLIKSIFVPGLGQMGKRYYAEGALTLVAELGTIAGAVSCYYGAKKQLSVMRTPDVSYADFLTAHDRYNTLRTTSYIMWGVAGTIYIFNIIRAVTAKPRYRADVVFAPSIIPTEDGYAPSLSLTYNF